MSERRGTVAVDVGVRLDMEELQRLMSPEQIAAVMEGVGKVIAAGRSPQSEKAKE